MNVDHWAWILIRSFEEMNKLNSDTELALGIPIMNYFLKQNNTHNSILNHHFTPFSVLAAIQRVHFSHKLSYKHLIFAWFLMSWIRFDWSSQKRIKQFKKRFGWSGFQKQTSYFRTIFSSVSNFSAQNILLSFVNIRFGLICEYLIKSKISNQTLINISSSFNCLPW